ncbi:MAG: hypothetical protein HY866_09130 [Chloroflexi bacterium]|nr:hypothetical protein [Chloroflexota bacterium]
MTVAVNYLVSAGTKWQIPVYAQEMLWVQSGDHTAQVSGARGAFSLEKPGETLSLLWGTADGPPLVAWSSPSVISWQGEAAVAGFVERLHALQIRGLEVVVAEIEGDALPPGYSRLPSLDQMRNSVFSRHETAESTFQRQFTYTLITMADSIYAEYLHHAMVSELAVDCFAVLGPQDGRWHEITGLPLLVQSISLLAPGYR